MNDFKIIKEETHKHKKDSLYILMFKSGSVYGVDVTNSVAGFGRITLENKEDTIYVFDRIGDLITEINDYLTSCQLCTSALKKTNFVDIVLFLHTYKKYLSVFDVNALIRMLGLTKTEKRNYDLCTHVISVVKNGETKEFGKFAFLLSEKKYIFYFL